MISGELTSSEEVYLELTETALQCVEKTKINAPGANGITWTLNTNECWAKYNSSNSTIDPLGCSYCQSCVFGKHNSYHYRT